MLFSLLCVLSFSPLHTRRFVILSTPLIANIYNTTPSAGGAGGGGDGGAADENGSSDMNGDVNTGGGGGGAQASNLHPGDGGSGLIIVRYSNSFTLNNADGGLTISTANTASSTKTSTITAGTGTVTFTE